MSFESADRRATAVATNRERPGTSRDAIEFDGLTKRAPDETRTS